MSTEDCRRPDGPALPCTDELSSGHILRCDIVGYPGMDACAKTVGSRSATFFSYLAARMAYDWTYKSVYAVLDGTSLRFHSTLLTHGPLCKLQLPSQMNAIFSGWPTNTTRTILKSQSLMRLPRSLRHLFRLLFWWMRRKGQEVRLATTFWLNNNQSLRDHCHSRINRLFSPFLHL